MQKQIQKFDIAVVGNGIRSVNFFFVKNEISKKLCLIGNKILNILFTCSRCYACCFCEIEQNFYKSQIEQSKKLA